MAGYTACGDLGTNGGIWQSWNSYGIGNYYGTGTTANTATSIWLAWNYQVVTVNAVTVNVDGTAVTQGDIWPYWNQYITGSQTVGVVYEEQVWSAWNEEYVPRSAIALNPILAKQPDAEQRAKLDEAKRIQEQKVRDEEAKRLAAKKRAAQLLKSTLSRKQQEQFAAIRSFDLEVGDKLYRVIPGQRVQRLNKQTKAVERYFCIHTAYDHPVPAEDTALAQKLLLEADEAQFLRIANESAA